MATSNADIWQRIISDGLLNQSQCLELQQKIAQSPNRDQEKDGLVLLRTLVALGAINVYQARVLSGNSKGPLRYGQWLILGRPRGKVWKDWFEIRKVAVTEDENSQSISSEPDRMSEVGVKWGRWLNPSTVKSLGGANSLVRRWRKWSQLDACMVQHSEMPTIVNDRLLLQVHPILGEPLSRCAAKAIVSPQHILQCVQSLATILATMHENGIVYGFLKPDRIFWDHEEGFKIVFEPVDASGMRRHSRQPNTSSSIRLLHNDLENLTEESFIAPNVDRSKQFLGPSADVYSLGAVWWWLLNQESPAESSSIPNFQQSDSRNLGISESQAKCLKRCLAVNPEERFSSATELLKALESSCGNRSDGTIKSVEATARRSPRVERKRRTRAPFLPLLASCIFLFVALIAMIWSGVFSGSTNSPEASIAAAPKVGLDDPKRLMEGDPREEHFQIVESQEYPWAPPSPPHPISLRWLPPGVQLIVVLHPSRLLQMPNSPTLLELFQGNQHLTKWLKAELDNTGVRFEELRRLTVALYSPLSEDSNAEGTQLTPDTFGASQAPAVVLRLELDSAYNRDLLKSLWNVQTQLLADDQTVIPLKNDRAIYVPPANQTVETGTDQGVTLFCIGPTDLITEAAELDGADGPINLYMKKLLERSNYNYDFSLLASPRFLFSDGKSALQALPSKLQALIEESLGRESRSLLVQSSIGDRWYWEVQAIGEKDSEAVELLKKWSDLAARASTQAEALLLEGNPHVYWRALAVRFPQMLRVWNQSTRFGIEDGAVVANGYLPSLASSNLIVAAWIAMQEDALPMHSEEIDDTQSKDNGRISSSDSKVQTVEIDDFLNRPITLSFEQEPLERAFELIGEEAQGGGLSKNQQFRFELDGAGFQRAGITRNQQIGLFQIVNQSVRTALTELARRGNPNPNISETSDPQQQLIWVVVDDPITQGGSIILLTTRTAAVEKRIPLPLEFTEVQEP